MFLSVACNSSCTGSGLCYGNENGTISECCNFYSSSSCVETCPDSTTPNSVFDCGKSKYVVVTLMKLFFKEVSKYLEVTNVGIEACRVFKTCNLGLQTVWETWVFNNPKIFKNLYLTS